MSLMFQLYIAFSIALHKNKATFQWGSLQKVCHESQKPLEEVIVKSCPCKLSFLFAATSCPGAPVSTWQLGKICEAVAFDGQVLEFVGCPSRTEVHRPKHHADPEAPTRINVEGLNKSLP